LKAARDQLFAEAVKLFEHGVAWHPASDFERQHIHPEQEARYETDPWEEPIRNHLKFHKPEKVYLRELLEGPLNIDLAGRSRAISNRVVAILERLGWTRLKKDSDGNIPWGPPS
jgi:predicted P-loop ATPase